MPSLVFAWAPQKTKSKRKLWMTMVYLIGDSQKEEWERGEGRERKQKANEGSFDKHGYITTVA